MSIRKILEKAILIIANHLKAEIGFFALRNEKKELHIVASTGLRAEEVNTLIIKDDDILMKPFLTEIVVRMTDLNMDSSQLHPKLFGCIKSFYCGLVSTKNIRKKRIGILFLGRKYDNSFTLDEERLIYTALSCLAVVLENTRLHEQLKNWNTELGKKVEKRTKELEKACNELKTLDQLKIKFMQDTAHELKTPLAVILPALKLLETTESKDKERHEKLMVLLTRNSERLRDIIGGILQIYQMEQGKTVYAREDVLLNDVIKHAVGMYQFMIDEKKLKIILNCGELPKIIGDKHALGIVMENLIENAVKFTQNGEITIKAEQKNGNITISIQDTGIGIPKKNQKHIFQRFYKIMPESPGVGVGLSICKEIIKAHGGDISFISTYGVGSVFTITLPIKRGVEK